MIYMIVMLLTATIAAAATASAAAAADPKCDCYRTDGPSMTYFNSHVFTDFRSLSQYAKTPAVISSVDGNANAGTTSPFFNWGTALRDFWAPQQYKNANSTFPMVKTLNNLYIQKDTELGGAATYLRMRTTRLAGFQTAAEMQSNARLDHASIRMHSRVVGSSGACGSVFTYLHSDDPRLVQESDVEILTRDEHGLVHYTNQPGVLDGESVPGATHEIHLQKENSWSDWTTHRLDWTAGRTSFFVNGRGVLNSGFQVPRNDSFVLVNMWSDGGDWTGLMVEHGEAYMDVQWIEVLHGLASKKNCRRLCTIPRPGIVVQE
ncbi:hypothetical protein E4U21_000278 [Claviceps maximensis]|nr:hypothetical protein E4U21_000278 [Claviceps maximensis]